MVSLASSAPGADNVSVLLKKSVGKMASPNRTCGAASTPHPHVTSRGVLDRHVVAAARHARRHLGGVLRLDPFEPVRPPRARVLLGFFQPAAEVADRRPAGPV